MRKRYNDGSIGGSIFQLVFCLVFIGLALFILSNGFQISNGFHDSDMMIFLPFIFFFLIPLLMIFLGIKSLREGIILKKVLTSGIDARGYVETKYIRHSKNSTSHYIVFSYLDDDGNTSEQIVYVSHYVYYNIEPHSQIPIKVLGKRAYYDYKSYNI